MRPSFARIFRPKRAWGTPDAQCTRGLVCNDSGRTHTSNNEYTGNHPAFPHAMVLTVSFVLPGDRALLPPSPADMFLSKPGWADLTSANLTPASGRQDHTTSPSTATSFVSSPFDRSRAFRQPALHHVARLTLPRPPHPTPRP